MVPTTVKQSDISITTSLNINLDAIAANIETLKKRQPQKKCIGVIKANGYGCGDVAMSRILEKHQCALLAVSSIRGAVHLRNHGVVLPILVLGVTAKDDLTIAKTCNIIITVPGYDWCLECNDQLENLRVHIKIDSGMNRLGCKSETEFKHCISILSDKGARIEGVFTHYAKSDDKDDTFSMHQFKLFASWVKNSNYPFKWIHADNTDATIKFDEDFTNAYRIGIGLVGLSSTNLRLYPAVSFTTKVVSCKPVKKGERVGYGLTHMFMDDGFVAVLPIGYDDGFLRMNQNRKVYINGRYYDVVGRVCMDQCMIYSKNRINRNETVEIFGPHIPLPVIANELNTIPYEVLCMVSDRVPRVYYHNNHIERIEVFRF